MIHTFLSYTTTKVHSTNTILSITTQYNNTYSNRSIRIHTQIDIYIYMHHGQPFISIMNDTYMTYYTLHLTIHNSSTLNRYNTLNHHTPHNIYKNTYIIDLHTQIDIIDLHVLRNRHSQIQPRINSPE